MKEKYLLIILFIVSIIACSISVTASITNISSYYKMDEPTGTNVIDSVGVYSPVSFGGMVSGNGILNTSKLFTSTGTWVNTSSNINDNQQFTFSFFANITKSQDYARVGAKIKPDYTLGWELMFVGATNTLRIQSGNGGYAGALDMVSNISMNSLNMYSFTWNNATRTAKIYVNGVLKVTDTANVRIATDSEQRLVLCKDTAGGAKFCDNIYLDEVLYSNIAYTDAQISELYNNLTNNQGYPFTTPSAPPIVITYNITLSSYPDINTSVINITLNLTVTANNTNLTGDTATIFYNPHTILNNNCSIFYQSKCIQNNYLNKTMTKVNNTFFTSTFEENDIFPAYYPYNISIIQATDHLNDTIYRGNNILWNVTNMSIYASQYIITMDFNAVNITTTTTSLLIYYCNNSYDITPPENNNNCLLVDSFASSSAKLKSAGKSKYNTIPISLNGITKTQQSYFIFRSTAVLQTNGWYMEYIKDNNYNNKSFKTCDNSFSCSISENIYDIHIHSYLSTDYFNLYSVLNDNGTLTTSNTITDYYNLTPFPPSAVNIINPLCEQQYTINPSANLSIFFNWTASQSINNLAIIYNLSIIQNSEIKIINNYNSTSYNYSTNGLTAGNYTTYVYSIDSLGFYDIGVQTCSFNICSNNWVKSLQPCTNGAKIINYTDLNICNEKFSIPSDNNFYEVCVADDITSLNNIGNGLYFIGVILLIILLLFFFRKKNSE